MNIATRKNVLIQNFLIPFLISSVVIILTFLFFKNAEATFTGIIESSKGQKAKFALYSFLLLTSDIVLPVPSSIIMFTNGYVLGISGGFIISLVSVTAGSVTGYFLGRFTSYGVRAKWDDALNRLIEKYGVMVILVSRGVPVLSESICIVSGYNKVPFKSYILLNIIGYIPVCLLYSFFGSTGNNKNVFLLSFACSLFLSGILWFSGRNILKRTGKNRQVKA